VERATASRDHTHGSLHDAGTPARREFGIVRESSSGADQHGIGLGAQPVHVRARGGAGDPARLTARGRDAPVERRRELQRDEGRLRRMRERSCVQVAGRRAPRWTDAGPARARLPATSGCGSRPTSTRASRPRRVQRRAAEYNTADGRRASRAHGAVTPRRPFEATIGDAGGT
jgi:hypothetical protein